MHEVVHHSLLDEYPKLASFRKNYMKHHPGENFDGKNLYVIQSINKDGVVTNEQYGLNLITDGGITWIRLDPNNTSRTLSLLEGVPEGEASSVLDYKFPTYTRKMDRTGNESANACYPMTYNSETGIVSQYIECGKHIFDYNISGFDSDMEVNCIVYYIPSSGWSNTPILKITTYDENGLPAPIIKHLNEKLIINMYTTNSFHESIIDDAYNRGMYIAMNPARLGNFGTGTLTWTSAVSFIGSVWTSYSRSGSGSSSSTVGVSTLGYVSDCRYVMQNGEFSWYERTGWTILSDPRVSYTKSILRYGRSYSAGFSDYGVIHIIDEIKLDSPEQITCDTVYTNDNESNLISNAFGLQVFNVNYCRGVIPVADFTISSVKGYNFTSHAWDIDIPFIDAPNAYYENPFSNYRIEVGINSAPVRWNTFVYTNPRAKNITGRPPAVPVTALAKTESGTAVSMYATDKWWDGSSWELISNMSSIPQSLQNKKYFISVGGDNGRLMPTYDQDVHRLNVGTEHTVLNTPSTVYWSYGFKPIINKTDGWILVQDHILFMNGNDVAQSYRLEGPEMAPWGYSADAWQYAYQNLYIYDGTDYVLNTSPTYSSRNNYYINGLDEHTIRYCVGNKLLVGGHAGAYGLQYPTTLRLFTISDASTAPTYIDIPVDTNTTDRRYPGMYSGTQEGYYVIQDQQTHCANIISLADGTVTKLENVMYCFAVEYSRYCIYMDYNSSPIMFHIYDMSTNTIRSDFILSSEYSNITYICGWRDLVYIKSKSGASDVVNVVNIESGSINPSNVVISNEFITSSSSSTAATNNAWRINMLAGQMYTHDVMILGQSKASSFVPRVVKYSDPDQSFALFKDGTLEERPVDIGFEQNTYSGKHGCIDSYVVHDIQSISQSKLLFVNPWGVQANSNSANLYSLNDDKNFVPGALDIGQSIDTGLPMNICISHGKTYTDQQYCRGGLVYWNNGVIQFDKNGAGVWRPLHWFVASQVTGTTYTIQAYNNPKKIGNKCYNIFRTNRGVIQHTEPIRSSGDIQMVFIQDSVGYSNGGEQGMNYYRILKGMVEGPFETKISIPNGTTVRIEVEPVEGFEFLIGTFRWYLQDIVIARDINGDYSSASRSWTSSLATADDKNQTNGTSITLDRDLNLAGVCVGTVSTELQFLSAAMIKSIKITTDPHLST